MANIARTVFTAIHHLGSKVTPAQALTVIVTVTALGAATLFWIATLDGVASVGWYRLGITVVYVGASLVWILKLRTELAQEKQRNRVLARRVAVIERDHDVLLEDAHIRKIIVAARTSGRRLPVVVTEDN